MSFGSYQLKQSISYTVDHLSEGGNYEIEIYKEMDNLIRVKISSRHSNQTCYNTWIKYSFDKSNFIKAYFCTCKAGARTIGCCAHVCSVLWYLGFHLKSKNKKLPISGYLNDIIDAKLNQNEKVTMQLMSREANGNVNLQFLGTKFNLRVLTNESYEKMKFMKPKQKVDLSSQVMSPMPGIVKSIAVQVGQKVLEGHEICTVEAMKMQNKLNASKTGIIKKINTKVGEQVEEGKVLVELE